MAGRRTGRVSWHMLEDQEATARRFSHELHDELGQSLTAIKTNLTALDGSGQADHARLKTACTWWKRPSATCGRCRSFCAPPSSTISAWRLVCAGGRGFAARTGVQATLESSCPGRLPDETETHLFRIAQEALTNVARHAGAKCVEVKLESSGDEIASPFTTMAAAWPARLLRKPRRPAGRAH